MKNSKKLPELWNPTDLIRGREQDKAEYLPQLVPEYVGNPLIEALPALLTFEQVDEELSCFPPYSKEQRNLPAEVRTELMENAREFYIPQARHRELQASISRMVRRSYINRNPAIWGYWNEFEKKMKMIENSVKKPEGGFAMSRKRSKSRGATVIGLGGTGKSTSVEGILDLFPQVVNHSKYKGSDFILKQLVWIKINCPQDGSIKGLCRAFFLSVDEILGTNYFNIYGGGGIDDLLINMARVAAIHSLGAFAIDEIQDLSRAKSTGADQLLSFLVHLESKIGVPYILIGTEKALPLLQGEFRQARRASEQGDFLWEPLERVIEQDIDYKGEILPNPEWDSFVRTLWDYQYTQKFTPLPDNILESPVANTLFNLCQGIPAIAHTLNILAQTRAVTSGVEEVTVEVLKSAAKDRQRLVQSGLDKLRSGTEIEVDEMSDLNPSKYAQRKRFLEVAAQAEKDLLHKAQDENNSLDMENEPQLGDVIIGEVHPKPNETTEINKLKETDDSTKLEEIHYEDGEQIDQNPKNNQSKLKTPKKGKTVEPKTKGILNPELYTVEGDEFI